MFHAIVSVIAVNIQFNSPNGVFLSLSLPGILRERERERVCEREREREGERRGERGRESGEKRGGIISFLFSLKDLLINHVFSNTLN